MKVIVYNAKPYEVPYFTRLNQNKHVITFAPEQLNIHSVKKITEADAVCCFVTDQLNRTVLECLKQKHVKLIALRSAGFDHLDLQAAKELDLTVVRVPAYSPHAVAEFTVGLILALTRKIIRAHTRIQQHDFSLDGQLGFNLQGKTIGIIGTGYIGRVDVYEGEKDLFFKNRSDEIILDDQFIRLQAFPNVLITGHQAFFSHEALENIVKITLENLSCFESGVIQNSI